MWCHSLKHWSSHYLWSVEKMHFIFQDISQIFHRYILRHKARKIFTLWNQYNTHTSAPTSPPSPWSVNPESHSYNYISLSFFVFHSFIKYRGGCAFIYSVSMCKVLRMLKQSNRHFKRIYIKAKSYEKQNSLLPSTQVKSTEWNSLLKYRMYYSCVFLKSVKSRSFYNMSWEWNRSELLASLGK